MVKVASGGRILDDTSNSCNLNFVCVFFWRHEVQRHEIQQPGLSVHFPLWYVAKINSPWPWPWPWVKRMSLLLHTDANESQALRHASDSVTVRLRSKSCCCQVLKSPIGCRSSDTWTASCSCHERSLHRTRRSRNHTFEIKIKFEIHLRQEIQSKFEAQDRNQVWNLSNLSRRSPKIDWGLVCLGKGCFKLECTRQNGMYYCVYVSLLCGGLNCVDGNLKSCWHESHWGLWPTCVAVVTVTMSHWGLWPTCVKSDDYLLAESSTVTPNVSRVEIATMGTEYVCLFVCVCVCIYIYIHIYIYIYIYMYVCIAMRKVQPTHIIISMSLVFQLTALVF